MVDKRMYVRKDKLKLRDDRLRKDVGDLDELKKSLEKEQIHDILIDENWNVRIGTRRFLASKERVWVLMKEGLTEDEWLWLEAEENLRRKNLTITEELFAEAKAKELYEKLYPETKIGQAGGESTKEKFEKAKRQNDVLPSDKLKIDPKSPIFKEADVKKAVRDSYSKTRAKASGVSVRTIERNIELGEAIMKGKVTKNEQEMLDKREISKQKVLRRLREEKKKKKVEREKKIDKLVNKIPSMAPPEPEPEPNMCEDCSKAQKILCCECNKGILICTKYKNLMVKSIDAEACSDFEKV